jgi:hypothetical protein
MPAENQQAVPKLKFNTPDAGRTYIAKLFDTVLRRHDYRQYISERLGGDFACTLAQHFEEIKARERILQLRLNAADQRNDELARDKARLGWKRWSRIAGMCALTAAQTAMPATAVSASRLSVTGWTSQTSGASVRTTARTSGQPSTKR